MENLVARLDCQGVCGNLDAIAVVVLEKETAMQQQGYTGLEFLEGFFLLAGALWIIGALTFGGAIMIGQAKLGGDVSPAANQTSIGEMPATQ